MGQILSCGESLEHGFFSAIQNGELEAVTAMVDEDPSVLELATVRGRLSPLHVAAANGQIQVLCMLLDRCLNPDVLNLRKQTPLMLAAMHGKVSCVERLIQAGANILTFDSLHGRTCLHYAAFYGHPDCLQAILFSCLFNSVAHSWGFTRFVNIRDKNGATPLHLAARRGRRECVRILLENGALVCASTGGYGYAGNAPLHLAAHVGSLDCVRELLAWGADRLQRDSSGRTPYMVALKHKHGACAALLNPSAPAPLIWPAALKFITDLNQEAKALLERALVETNKEREKAIFEETAYSPPSLLLSEAGVGDDVSEGSEGELCCICFDQHCTIKILTCGHQMCANCTIALCCYKQPNPNPLTPNAKAPVCPFCRSNITQLVLAEFRTKKHAESQQLSSAMPNIWRKSYSATEGCGSSSSIKSLPAMGPLGKLGGRTLGKAAGGCDEGANKP